MSLVNLVGIGAQKTASTWLFNVLSDSPDVSASEVKEVDYFSAFFDRGQEWYERHFADEAKQAKYVLEVSPSYFIHSDVPARVRNYNPDAKIVALLRDPVDRAYSNHLHEVRAGHATGDNAVFENGMTNNPLYLDQGLYAQHLERWLTQVPRENMHIAFQEDIADNPEREVERLARFLDIDIPRDLIRRRANESIVYNNKIAGEALWRAGKAARNVGLGTVVERIKAIPAVKAFRTSNRADLKISVPKMTGETETTLVEYFRDDVARLEKLVGAPVPWPRFAANR